MRTAEEMIFEANRILRAWRPEVVELKYGDIELFRICLQAVTMEEDLKIRTLAQENLIVHSNTIFNPQSPKKKRRAK